MSKSNIIAFDALSKEIKAGIYKPVYFLEGSEPYFIDKISDIIEKNALNESEKGFNQTVIYGRDTDLNAVITAAKRFPMMAQRTVVIVKEAQELKDLEKIQKIKSGGKEIEFNALIDYLKKPLDSTVLVFCYKYKTLDQRKALGKALKEGQVAYFTSTELRDYEMEPVVKQMVHENGMQISLDAIQLIINHIGTQLSRIDSELQKLAINLKKGETITDQHIHTYVGISKEYNVFELQKALAQRHIHKAYKIASYFSQEASDGELNKNLSTLFGFYYKVWLVKKKGARTPKDAASILNMHEFTVQDIYQCARYLSDQKIMEIFSYLREADLRSKGYNWGKSDPLEIYKELIFKLVA